MNGVETSLYSAAFALCVFSAGLVRGRTGERRAGTYYFTAFLAIEALSFVCEVLMAHPATPWKCLWLGLRMGLSLLIAPCLWLTVRESVEELRPRLGVLGRWHWAAVAGGVVGLLPLWSATHGGTDFPDPLRPAGWLYAKLIHAGMLLCIGVFAVQVPWYAARVRQLLLAKADAPRWLQWPLLIVSTTWLLGLLRTVQCATHAPREFALLFAAVDVSVTVGALYLIVRRGPGERATPGPMPMAVAAKYARSSLDAATVDRIKAKLGRALAQAEVCGDSLLNLRSLSRTMGEKAHSVSQVINQELQTNFYELVNRQRIARAKQRLLAAPDETVLEIALAVGFNAKSTFNTAFRKETGMTPSEFRAKRSRGAV
jgi:AraC-like DNA-binding protein